MFHYFNASLLTLMAALAMQPAHAIVRPLSPAEKDCAITVDQQLKQRYGADAHLQFSEFKQKPNNKVLGSGKLVTDTKELGQLKFACLLDPQTEQIKRIIYQKLIKPRPVAP